MAGPWDEGRQRVDGPFPSPLPARTNFFATRLDAMTDVMSAVVETERAGEPNSIRPFRVNFPDTELAELRRRIIATRWPERETVSDASQGVQLATPTKTRAY